MDCTVFKLYGFFTRTPVPTGMLDLAVKNQTASGILIACHYQSKIIFSFKGNIQS